MDERVIVFADKSVLKIEGLRVRGLKPSELESTLREKLQTTVRLIGVTGDSVELDVYGLEPEAIMKDKAGLIRAVSLVEGIRANEVETMASTRRAVAVDIDRIPPRGEGCAGERWNPDHAD
ncbi:MAG: hypothetical protein ACOC29_00265 [Candidatus Sumerlaeota bacterium]